MEADYKYDAKELGRRIAVVRNYRGIRQADIARELNVSQPTYSAYEHGTIALGSDKLALLGVILEVDLNWLLGLPSGEGKGPF